MEKNANLALLTSVNFSRSNHTRIISSRAQRGVRGLIIDVRDRRASSGGYLGGECIKNSTLSLYLITTLEYERTPYAIHFHFILCWGGIITAEITAGNRMGKVNVNYIGGYVSL